MLEIFLWQKQWDCWDWPESSTAKAYMGGGGSSAFTVGV
jgi:hypothetical protein